MEDHVIRNLHSIQHQPKPSWLNYEASSLEVKGKQENVPRNHDVVFVSALCVDLEI